MISLQTAIFEHGSHMDTYDSLIIGGRMINNSTPPHATLMLIEKVLFDRAEPAIPGFAAQWGSISGLP